MRFETMAAVAAFAAAAAPACAQTPSEAQLEEVIVTATKRAESLQDVPLAVSAFSGDTLQRAGVEDTRQLMSLAPSLHLNVTTSDSAGVVIRLRGLGSEAINPGLESSVATFVDGVYRSRSNLSLAAVPGIERVEVLRGPQGTLFGKNTSAGLINVITRRPAFDPEVEASASFGNYAAQQYVVGVTGPLAGDKLAGRLDAALTRRDGWLSDFSTGARYRNKDQVTVRGQLLWQGSESLTGRLIADVSEYDQTGPDTYVVKSYDPVSRRRLEDLGARTVLGLDSLSITMNPDRQSRELNRQWGLSGEVNWRLGEANLTVISAYRDWRNKQAREVDYSELDLLYVPFGGARQNFKTFTQELRLDGRAGRLDWLVGGFFSDEQVVVDYGFKVGRDFERYFDLVFAGSTGQPHAISFFTGLPVGAAMPEGVGYGLQRFEQSGRGFSLFTQESFRVSSRLTITAGLRYTREKKTLDITTSDAFNPGCDALVARGLSTSTPVSGIVCLQGLDPRYEGRFQAGKTESEWSGLLTAAYAFTDDINGYVTFSRGYKAGGFVIDPSGFRLLSAGPPDANDTKFDPEFAENLELGLKTQFLERRLTVNSAIFRTRLTDYQLSYNTGSALLTRNIPKVTSTGAEVETSLRPVPAVHLSLNATYADASYGDFPSALALPPNIAALANRRLHNAPLWTVTASADWEREIGGGLSAFAHADARYQSAVITERTLRPGSEQDEYTTVNARVGISGLDKRWSLELWGRNLGDERYFVAAIPATFQGSTLVGVPGEPRTYGVLLRARW